MPRRLKCGTENNKLETFEALKAVCSWGFHSSRIWCCIICSLPCPPVQPKFI